MSTHKHQCGLITTDDKGGTELLTDFGCHHVWEHQDGTGQIKTTIEVVREHSCPACGRGPWYARYTEAPRALRALVVAAALALTQACVVVPAPHTCFANVDHLSHPLQGQPFMGHANEEGVVNIMGATCRWERGRVFMESGLSYMFNSDLYGDDFIYNGRIAVKLWEQH